MYNMTYMSYIVLHDASCVKALRTWKALLRESLTQGMLPSAALNCFARKSLSRKADILTYVMLRTKSTVTLLTCLGGRSRLSINIFS